MSERNAGSSIKGNAAGLSGHWSVIWFHVVGAGMLTIPQLLMGGENTVCTAWNAFNMAGTESLGCAAKTYLSLMIALSALWLTIFAVPAVAAAAEECGPATAEAHHHDHHLSPNLQMAGLTARFAVFFAISMVALESVAHLSQWVGPLAS